MHVVVYDVIFLSVNHGGRGEVRKRRLSHIKRGHHDTLHREAQRWRSKRADSLQSLMLSGTWLGADAKGRRDSV